MHPLVAGKLLHWLLRFLVYAKMLPNTFPARYRWPASLAAHCIVNMAVRAVVSVTQRDSFARHLCDYFRTTEVLFLLYHAGCDVCGCVRRSRGLPDLPEHRVRYCVANLVKALVLALLVAATCKRMGEILAVFYGQVPGGAVAAFFRTSMMVYGATDLAQFGTVRMNAVTTVHHVLTSVIGAAAYGIRSPIHPLVFALAIFGLFSSAAYSVNAYLALRHLTQPSAWLETLRAHACFLYRCTLGLNVGAQVAIVGTFVQGAAVGVEGLALATVYTAVVGAFLYADVVLLRALEKPV